MKSLTLQNRVALLFGVLAATLAAASVEAVQTGKFSNDTFEDFSEGESHGLAITSDGFVRLGLEAQKWISLTTPVVWAAVRDPGGTLYVAAGNEGQVFRIGRDGKPEEYFKARELEVQALALDRKGALYAASSPEGKIYRIEGKGKSSVFFDPKEKYIWALQFDADGNLFAATGDKGRLYKIPPSGKGKVFYDSDEVHLRTLLLDSNKRLWAGSDGNGLVYRFDQTSGATGVPFVAYDSNFREIKAMAAAPDGSIFVGAMGDGKGAQPASMPSFKSSSSGGPAAAAAIAALGAAMNAGAEGPKAEETPSVTAAHEKPGAGEIVRILPDGSVEKWWSDSEDVFALAVNGRGRLWAGTGRKGRLIELTAPRQWSVLAQLEAETITALIPAQGGWLAATSNGGAIWTLATGPGRKGTLESKVFDAHASARWGTLDFRGTTGDGKVEFMTRSGNTLKPDKVWNDWAPLDRQGRIQSAVAHCLQYKLLLESGAKEGAAPPSVDSVTVFYQPRNQSPGITRVSVLPSNIELVKMPKLEGPLPPLNPLMGGAPAGRNSKSPGGDAMAAAMLAAMKGPILQQSKRLGWRSVIWQASDPDNDMLVFDVSYRAAGSEAWRELKKDVRENFLAWDAATWPDGDYYVRVVASDLPDNRQEDARTGEMTSDVFTVDNTAPEIQVDVSAETLAKGNVAFTISDTTSVVDQAEYSLDGAEWRPLLPVGGLYDSKSNRFLIPIQHLKTGEHYVVVRASDAADNISSRTVKFKKQANTR